MTSIINKSIINKVYKWLTFLYKYTYAYILYIYLLYIITIVVESVTSASHFSVCLTPLTTISLLLFSTFRIVLK